MDVYDKIADLAGKTTANSIGSTYIGSLRRCLLRRRHPGRDHPDGAPGPGRRHPERQRLLL